MQSKNTASSTAKKSILAGALALGLATAIFALETPGVPSHRASAANRYIGSGKCKNCHRAEAGGNQYSLWLESKHAQAWKTLGMDKAREAGAPLGVEKPQESEKCLKCHVTAFGVGEDEIKRGFDAEQGVQCESCHGPGEKHMKARLMAAADQAEGEEIPYVHVPEDEIVALPMPETCLGCHNEESPSFRAFCFHERMGKIRHLNPRKPRTDEERAAKLVCGCGEACPCVHGCEEECGVPPGS